MARPATSLVPKPSRGKVRLSRGSRIGLAGFDRDYHFEIEESRDWDDHVLVVTTNRGTGRASGVPISRQTAQLMTLRDGKIVRQDFFADRGAALEAAGLSE